MVIMSLKTGGCASDFEGLAAISFLIVLEFENYLMRYTV